MNHKKQQGVSLISILIGLLLGLIAILSATSMYKTLVLKSTDLQSSAKQDFLVNTAMIATDIDISKAGYGIEDAATSCFGAEAGPSGAVNVDFIILKNAALVLPNDATSTLTGTSTAIAALGSAAVSGNAVIWHYIDTGVSQCAGIVSTLGGLVRLSPMACTNATNWNTMTWKLQKIIDYNTLPSANGAIADKAFVFGAKISSSCIPYKTSDGFSAVDLSITAGNSASNLTSTQNLCLTNICQ